MLAAVPWKTDARGSSCAVSPSGSLSPRGRERAGREEGIAVGGSSYGRRRRTWSFRRHQLETALVAEDDGPDEIRTGDVAVAGEHQRHDE